MTVLAASPSRSPAPNALFGQWGNGGHGAGQGGFSGNQTFSSPARNPQRLQRGGCVQHMQLADGGAQQISGKALWGAARQNSITPIAAFGDDHDTKVSGRDTYTNPEVPLVLRPVSANMELGRDVIRNSCPNVIAGDDLTDAAQNPDAAQKIVKAVKG